MIDRIMRLGSLWVVCIALFLVGSNARPALADEPVMWHRMQLFCSTKSNVAVAVPEGTWVEGKFELPAGISQLTRGLERIEDGDCQLPDGRIVRLEQKRLPYSTHACGADPGGAFSITLDKTPIYPETDYYYCHRGYLILAVVINEGSVQTCTWRTGDPEPTTGVTYFDTYKCQDDSLRLPTP